MTSEIIRIAVLLLIFATVFIVAQLAGSSYAKSHSHRSAINKRLQMIGAGRDREEIIGQLIKNRPQAATQLPWLFNDVAINLQRIVFTSGIAITAVQLMFFMILGFAAALILSIFSLAFLGYPLNAGTMLMCAFFSLGLAIALPILIVSRMADSRRKKMEYQFPIALDIFVRALRSGHPIASAIDLLTKEMEDPIGSEFGLISDEVAYGADLIGALENMAERWDLDDMRMFVVSLSVQSQTGGNLAEILENISKVIRDRHQMYLKVRALSSEGRMTAWMLTGLPIFGFVSIFLLVPEFYLDSADDPIFIYSSITLFVMYLMGVYIIRRLIDLKV